MLKLAKRPGSHHWQITGTLRGIRVRESTGTDSRAHAEALLAERQKSILDRDVYGERATATFAEAVNLYLDLGGEARYLAPLVQRWGTQRLAAITPLEIGRTGRALYPGVAASTLNRQLYTPTIAVLSAAAEAGLCARPDIARPKQRRTLVEAASDEWIMTVLLAPPRTAWADDSRGRQRFEAARRRLRALVMLMTLTGARISEAVALQWRQVQLERDKPEALLGRTKNGEPRRVPLGPALVDALQALPRGAPESAVLGYASRYPAAQALRRAAIAAGMPHFSPHQVGRHAFAARMLADGHTLKTVQEGGGWKDLGIVARHYGHLERSAVDDAVRSAGAKLTQAAAQPGANIIKLNRKP